jgi:hypothetical protein
VATLDDTTVFVVDDIEKLPLIDGPGWPIGGRSLFHVVVDVVEQLDDVVVLLDDSHDDRKCLQTFCVVVDVVEHLNDVFQLSLRRWRTSTTTAKVCRYFD